MPAQHRADPVGIIAASHALASRAARRVTGRRSGPARHRRSTAAPSPDGAARGPSRRAALGALAATSAGWSLSATLSPAQAAVRVPQNPAPALPEGLVPYLEVFANWSGETRTSPVWTVTPSSPEQIATLAQWCAEHGWRLRARGYQHNWSPLSVDSSADSTTRVLLVNMLKHFTQVAVDPASSTVTAEAGASLDSLLDAAQSRGLSILHHPAPGDITVAGALAIGAHGTGIPAARETVPAGGSFGSMSNLVIWLEAVVWDEQRGAYTVQRFERSDPRIGALLTCLGRTIITRVALRFTRQPNLRCRSDITVPTWELFDRPGSRLRTMESFLRRCGRVEVILFPFTFFPWLKTWEPARSRPWLSRWTGRAYNYAFSDRLPDSLTRLIRQVQTTAPSMVMQLGPMQHTFTNTSLLGGALMDLWGAPKNLMLYVRPSTLRVTANGYAIHCRRADVQRVLYEFYAYYSSSINAQTRRWRFPMNGPLEIRVTGVDDPADVGIPGAVEPALSPSRPFANHPEWDTVVWLDILTFPGTPYSPQYFRECEQWILRNYASYAGVRVEWSKGWAYTDQGAWQEPSVLDGTVPASFSGATAADPGTDWNASLAALDALDPARIFTAPLHDRLMPRRADPA